LSRACGLGQQADGGLLGELADRDLFTAGRAQRPATRGVEPVSRAWRSEVSGGRVTVYAAAGLEGALVVSFFVAVQLLLNKDYFSLSAAQHGAVYAPLCAAAVLAAFFALRGSRAAARGRLFRLGLCLSAAGRVILIATVLGAVRHAAVFFPESQAGLIGRDPDAISSWALGLGAFLGRASSGRPRLLRGHRPARVSPSGPASSGSIPSPSPSRGQALPASLARVQRFP